MMKNDIMILKTIEIYNGKLKILKDKNYYYAQVNNGTKHIIAILNNSFSFSDVALDGNNNIIVFWDNGSIARLSVSGEAIVVY